MEQLEQLFRQWAGVECQECLALGANGSNRRYYRLRCDSLSAIGCVNDDRRENEAFFAFCRHLHDKGIRVPELYAVADDRRHYLQQDLGDQTLYGLLQDKKRQGGGFDAQMMQLYRQALADLAAIQVAGRDMDFGLAYPRPAFDRRSILWDLNYFKYHFLKFAHIPFDEERLEDDFDRLTHTLLQADCSYFLYRDFNPRNIMVEGASADGGNLYYIDFQGGRRGAAQYDVASLLYSAKSDLPEALRLDLLNHYLLTRGIQGEDKQQWLCHFWAYVLVRILQALGAYGYRGLCERKEYFRQSIPLALANLRALAENHPDLLEPLPELARIIAGFGSATPQGDPDDGTLTVTILSFSFKQGLPEDPSGNGGGFIFDCRALPNPGRYAEYKTLTGRDRPVREFLEAQPPVAQFLDHAQALVAQSVEKYLERRFTSLMVCFGCTGGQHRSVYCAEQLAARLRAAYPVRVVLRHREQE